MTSTTELRRHLHHADLQWERQHDGPARGHAGDAGLDWLCALVWAVFTLWCLGTLAALAALAAIALG